MSVRERKDKGKEQGKYYLTEVGGLGGEKVPFSLNLLPLTEGLTKRNDPGRRRTEPRQKGFSALSPSVPKNFSLTRRRVDGLINKFIPLFKEVS